MKQKIIFIASLHRSGSTVLELILQNWPSVTGIGEVGGFLKSFHQEGWERYCDCGKKALDCDFWGPARKPLEGVNKNNYTEMYRVLLKTFRHQFGDKAIAVDSTKTLQMLQALQNIEGIDLRVIHLIRDVRAYVTSNKINSGGQKMQGAFRYFLRWHRNNLKIKEHLKRTKANYLRIGYEELILYQKASMQKIADFMELDASGFSTGLKHRGHSIGGNRMREDSNKRENVIYDGRWFYNDNYWLFPMIFMPHVMRFNKQNVYGNIVHPFQR